MIGKISKESARDAKRVLEMLEASDQPVSVQGIRRELGIDNAQAQLVLRSLTRSKSVRKSYKWDGGRMFAHYSIDRGRADLSRVVTTLAEVPWLASLAPAVLPGAAGRVMHPLGEFEPEEA